MRWTGFAALLVGLIANVVSADEVTEIFQRRILPIARSQQSSCTECHFGGVDLKQYILEDSAQTFAALREAGMINVERPGESKLLTFIGRKPEKTDALIAKVRAEELAAFTTWIDAAVKDPVTRKAKATGKPIGPEVPLEVVRHARHDRVLQSFVENIWVEIERCVGCHSPEKNQRLIKEHGERISWISPNDPAGTLAKAAEQGIIDLDQPEKSLILQKPTGLVKHGGHIKFLPGSTTDKRFRRFLNDYAAVVNETYRTTADLPKTPAEVIVATGQHLRVTDLPKDWGGRLMQVRLHRWENGNWSDKAVAFGDSPINGNNGNWQTIMFSLLPREKVAGLKLLERRQLPADRYQARFYVDRDNHIAENRDYEFTESDRIGTMEFDGEWKPGYQPPKIVTAPKQ